MSDSNLLAQSDRCRQRLYEVLAREDLSLSEKRERALEVGREFLGVENGHVERIVDEETHEVVASVGATEMVPVGSRLDSSTTYCRRTLEKGSALAVSDAGVGGWAEDPAPRERGYDCYLGAPIDVDGEPFGTVCFVSTEPRERRFEADERAFVELIARLLGREREAVRRRQQLRERERELDARERALDRSERELRVKNRAIERASTGITIADAGGDREDGLPLVYANPAFAELTGYDREAVLDRDCRFLQGPDTDESTVEEIREALAAEEPIRTEIRNYRADGTAFWNDLSIAPVTDEDGETTHFVGFQHDVTDRKRRSRLISVLNRVLRHNLRNKTNVVIGHAAALAERTDSDGLAEEIKDAATDLAALGDTVNDLQRVVRDDADPRPADVVPAVEAAVSDCLAGAPGASVTVETPDSLRAIAPPRLRMAVRELVENAVEHGSTSPPSQAQEDAVEHTDGPVTVRVEREADTVAISVEDEGPGLPPNERTVLQRGYETTLEHGGGLGLALVTWIVTGAGGQVDATVEDGTTVTIRLRGVED